MAFSMTTDFSLPLATPAASIAQTRNSRRRITPQAGRALEKLGHAIEYLTDEFVHRGGEVSSSNGALQAVKAEDAVEAVMKMVTLNYRFD